MDWIEFLFGWMSKGYCQTSILDGLMFVVELMLIFGIGSFIYSIKEKRKERKRK